jgi:hypothetical protein
MKALFKALAFIRFVFGLDAGAIAPSSRQFTSLRELDWQLIRRRGQNLLSEELE